jgi:ADP-ribose pyrophosphatase YjhB (NUDIX family)
MPEKLDITFIKNGHRFNYRTAGIYIYQKQLLLQRVVGKDMLFLPGGRVHLGETGEEALRREMHEELDSTVKVGRLIWVVENFFKMDGEDWQEMSLYYRMTLPAKAFPLKRTELLVQNRRGGVFLPKNEFISLERLSQVNLVPSFLKSALLNLPGETKHIVHRDV